MSLDELRANPSPTVKPAGPDATLKQRKLHGRRASKIEPEHVAWLWPGRLPARRLTLVGGKPGEGKSALTMDLVSRLSRGARLPDGHQPAGAINCALLSAEDDANDTIVPRLIAAGADLDRVYVIGPVETAEGVLQPWTLPTHVPELERYIEEHKLGLVIIDPLSAFISAKVDSHRESAVRGMLLPLALTAKKTGCAVLGVRHLRKGSTSDPRDAGTGSGAFTAAARMEWVVGRDPQDDKRRILATTKNNLAQDPPSLAYFLESARDCEWDAVVVAWNGTSEITATQLTAEPASDDDKSALDEAVGFLTELLADGPLPAKAAAKEAEGAGITGATLRRAKQRLGIKSEKQGAGSWVWVRRSKVFKEGAQQSGDEHVEHVEHVEHLRRSERDSSKDFIEGAQGAQGAHVDSAMAIFAAERLLLAEFSSLEPLPDSSTATNGTGR
jgi:hypothetical protein